MLTDKTLSKMYLAIMADDKSNLSKNFLFLIKNKTKQNKNKPLFLVFISQPSHFFSGFGNKCRIRSMKESVG